MFVPSALRPSIRLSIPISMCLAALGCGAEPASRSAPTLPGPGVEPERHAAVSSSSVGASPIAPATALDAPPVEREDLPLGEACAFDLMRPAKDVVTGSVDPEWERRKGQRFVRCHFLLSPRLPPFDVEIVSTPGKDAMESLTVYPAGERSSATVFTEDLTLRTRLLKWQIEAIDVDFDGIKDLVMPWTWGSIGCTSYHYFVYVPRSTGGAPARFVDSNMKDLCNPTVDPRRKLVLTDSFDGEGTVRWRWNGHEFAKVR